MTTGRINQVTIFALATAGPEARMAEVLGTGTRTVISGTTRRRSLKQWFEAESPRVASNCLVRIPSTTFSGALNLT
jgi:hypothetical protein